MPIRPSPRAGTGPPSKTPVSEFSCGASVIMAILFRRSATACSGSAGSFPLCSVTLANGVMRLARPEACLHKVAERFGCGINLVDPIDAARRRRPQCGLWYRICEIKAADDLRPSAPRLRRAAREHRAGRTCGSRTAETPVGSQPRSNRPGSSARGGPAFARAMASISGCGQSTSTICIRAPRPSPPKRNKLSPGRSRPATQARNQTSGLKATVLTENSLRSSTWPVVGDSPTPTRRSYRQSAPDATR
jgi:hypothetical protein